MKRVLIAVAMAACLSGVARGQGDPLAQRRLDSITQGRKNGDEIQTLVVKGDATVGGTLTAARVAVGSLTNALAKGNTVLDIRTGVCTNGATISFTPAFAGTPCVVGSYIGQITSTQTNAYGSLGGALVLDVVGVNSFKLVPQGGTSTYHTNSIVYVAIYSAN